MRTIILALALLAAPVSAQTAQPAQHLTIAELRAKYGDSASRYTDIGGMEIRYKDEGKGPVILMVHGSQSSLATWDKIADKLKSRYRIIRYDIPGYGLSGRVSDEAAASVTPVQIATTLLDKLGVKKANVVGVSSGGTLGMFLAAERPDLVERLILSNTPADPVRYEHMVQPESFKRAQARATATRFQDQDFWNEYLSYFAGDPARFSTAKRIEYYDMNRRTPEKYPITMVARIGDGKLATELMGKVKAPTLLLWGGADQLLTPAAADRLEGYLKSTQVSKVIMPDVGHYPPVESGERFAALMAAWIEDATPGR